MLPSLQSHRHCLCAHHFLPSVSPTIACPVPGTAQDLPPQPGHGLDTLVANLLASGCQHCCLNWAHGAGRVRGSPREQTPAQRERCQAPESPCGPLEGYVLMPHPRGSSFLSISTPFSPSSAQGQSLTLHPFFLSVQTWTFLFPWNTQYSINQNLQRDPWLLMNALSNGASLASPSSPCSPCPVLA